MPGEVSIQFLLFHRGHPLSSKKPAYDFGIVTGNDGSQVQSQQESVGILDVIQFRGKYIVAKYAIAFRFITAKQRRQIVEIFPPAIGIFCVRHNLLTAQLPVAGRL